jgi:uncharacterized protein YjhX (UPF0386 family)
MAAKKKARRTTHRSSKGTKLYAKRDAKGRITDIQTYKRAHGADLKRKAKAEKPAKRRPRRKRRSGRSSAGEAKPKAVVKANAREGEERHPQGREEGSGSRAKRRGFVFEHRQTKAAMRKA